MSIEAEMSEQAKMLEREKMLERAKMSARTTYWVLTLVRSEVEVDNDNLPSTYNPAYKEDEALLGALSELLASYHYKIRELGVLSSGVAYDVYFHAAHPKTPVMDLGFREALDKWIVGNYLDYCLQLDNPDDPYNPNNSKHRQKELLICDMDGTLIFNETLNDLATLLGIGSEVTAITKLAMDGKLDFETALRKRVQLLKGQSTNCLEQIIGKLKLRPEVKLFMRTLRKRGVWTILASGGFKPITTYLKTLLGFDQEVANTFGNEDNQFTGEILPPYSFQETKNEVLRQVTKEQGLRLENTLAVGDGANDLPMLRAAGMSVLFHPSEALLNDVYEEFITTFHGFAIVRYTSFRTILYFQGYREKDFVSDS